MSVEKYLQRYAEPERELALRVEERYGRVLVVPALGESLAFLEGYRAAARAAESRVLLVLVVNAAATTAPELRAENAELLDNLEALDPGRERLSENAFLARDTALDILVIDRSSPGHELPRKSGVGLARKIGMDLALALWSEGKIGAPWLASSDADASLPADYFARTAAVPGAAAALLYPFRHVAGAEPEVDRATFVYEVVLRYHVLGLAWAGSPYAYHSVGSTLAVRAESYAAVRGVPRREAGEDFYLLDKLAKVGAIVTLKGDEIRIRARRSSRVPFGTGPRVARIAEERRAAVAHPDAFGALSALLLAFDAFAARKDERELASPFEALPGSLSRIAQVAFDASSLRAAAVAVASQPGALRRRLHTWFDGLATLRFLHALRDAGAADLPYERALALAPFTPSLGGRDLDGSLSGLCELEQALPTARGPAALFHRELCSRPPE